MRTDIKNKKTCFTLLSVLGTVILLSSLFSCFNSNTKNKESFETTEFLDVEDAEEEKSCTIKPNFNIYKFKIQLDSLLSTIESKDFQFQLNIDSITEKSHPDILWNFGKWGLFRTINSENTSQLILYHFFDPKTSKILRIYLIEAFYNDSIIFNNVYQTFLIEKDRKKLFMMGEEGEEHYIDYGLTWLNDYVIILENKIYWLNVSLQYSNKSFNKMIAYFKDNLSEKNYIDTIKVTPR